MDTPANEPTPTSLEAIDAEVVRDRPIASGAVSPVRGGAACDHPPVSWRELLAVLLLVVVADVTVYRAHGFAGYAALFLFAPPLLWMGAPQRRCAPGFWVLAVMLILLVGKLLWCGSWLLVASGMALVVAFAMALAGICPYVLETIVFATQTGLAGLEGLRRYLRSADKLSPAVKRIGWLSVLLPLAAFLAFGLLFVVANPDLFVLFGQTVERLLTTLREWILQFAPSWQEALFWLVVLWIGIGLLRPVLSRVLLEAALADGPDPGATPARALFYGPFRNTLITVIVLFAVYLVFEFQTLWFRVFPVGFHYSGYAHEGAAWLTVALALATVVLSLIFRGAVLRDPRLPRLRWLAWVWSVENLLLAAAVFHRLSIYVGFNGMTRMRMIGIFGTSCVVAGFIIVVWKIARNRDFVWLLRLHLWALAITVFLFALTPVDAIVTRYNVARILAGDPAPSVEISVHPINAEGIPFLLPLLDCEDEIIREGVRALLAKRHDEAELRARRREPLGWTTYQAADRLVLDRLRTNQSRWAAYRDLDQRRAAWERFQQYAYRWY